MKRSGKLIVIFDFFIGLIMAFLIILVVVSFGYMMNWW